jgi:hypothetical protein
VKPGRPQNNGRFPGLPDRLGNSGGHASTCRNTWKLTGSAIRPASSRPSPARPSILQRPSTFPGGSDTTKYPPLTRKGAAHSAVIAGRPNDRATTTSKAPRNPATRPRSSARPRATPTRLEAFNRSTTSSKNSELRSAASSQTNCVAGHSKKRAAPGIPPPDPRSNTRAGGVLSGAVSLSACANPRACSMCARTGCGPSRPRR